LAGCPRLAGCASARHSGGVSSARPGPRGQCNCNMISTWKKYFPAWQIILQLRYTKPNLPYSKRHLYCYCRTHTATDTATHNAVLPLRERANPCALCVAHTPAALLGGLAGSGSGLAGLAVAGWPHPGVVIGCIATPCYRPVLQVGRRLVERLIDYRLACDKWTSRASCAVIGLYNCGAPAARAGGECR